MNKKTEHGESLYELRKIYDRRSKAAQGLNVMPPFDEDLMWCEIAWEMAQQNPLMSESTIDADAGIIPHIRGIQSGKKSGHAKRMVTMCPMRSSNVRYRKKWME